MVLRLVQDPATDGQKVLNINSFAEWEDAVQRDPVSRLAQTALAGTRLGFLLANRERLIADIQVFNVQVELEGKVITDQKASGRCWIFSMLNILRLLVSRRYNLEDFQLSQSYVFFMDHMSKANSFLEQVLNMAALPLESREMTWLFGNAEVQDGGDYDVRISLITEFGVVPQMLYPETWESSHTDQMDTLINSKLRDFALDLRQAYEKSLNRGDSHAMAVQQARELKADMLKEVYKIMAICVGSPPQPFVWEFEDKNKKYRKLVMTPVELAQSLGHGLEQTMVLANDPRNQYNVSYSFQGGGEVIGGRMIKYVNVPIEEMKAAAIKQLKNNVPVWFGVDVMKADGVAQKFGIMDTKFNDLEKAFSLELNMDKAERLRTGDSSSDHAMVFTGVNLDENGRPIRWRVENSWGPKACNHGFLVMTDEFFDEFVYEVAVPKAVVPRQFVNIYEQTEPVMLPSWDAMA
ncbi:bleomycin hydrolase [Pseudohyphozyma bogoriensis]|nr:bleomycin hydrolase [Pseudohyphozyma bogoriensis]